jgi:hypothetical protein
MLVPITSLDKESAINTHDLIRHISRLHHPYHRVRNLFRVSQPSDGDFFSRQHFNHLPKYNTRDIERTGCILFASSSLFPGSIVVSWISAGATPFTVIPDFAYALAIQWTKPWSADLEDLNSISALLLTPTHSFLLFSLPLKSCIHGQISRKRTSQHTRNAAQQRPH